MRLCFIVSFSHCLDCGGHVSACVSLSCVHMYVCLCDCMRAMRMCLSMCWQFCRVLARASVCLSDCLFRPPTPTPPPPSLHLSLTLTLFFSSSLSRFHSASSSPARSLACSPSSSLCNNSADLVSACSGLPVEFYSRLPSWLLCCSKTQAEKHDCGFFFLPFSHRYSFIPSPFFGSLKKSVSILNK